MTESDPRQSTLQLSVAQRSLAGIKPGNEDALGIRLPDVSERQRGAALVIADGVSSADAGRQAAEAAVQGFLSDYYATPDTWSIQSAGERVVTAINHWLHGRGQAHAENQGWLTTFTALVLRGRSAHILHIGDTRVYRLRGDTLEPLTQDHCTRINADTTYLSRALGMDWRVDIDYRHSDIEVGDLFLTCSDGVHGFISNPQLKQLLREQQHDLEALADTLLATALAQGSNDNLSCQLARVESVGLDTHNELGQQQSRLPVPPSLLPGQTLDGYFIEAEVHASPRSHLYRVRDSKTGQLFALKAPSEQFEDDEDYRSHFAIEGWIGQRITHKNLIRIHPPTRAPQCLYHIMDWLEGESLAGWHDRQARVDIAVVVGFARQIVAGLRALHRRDTLHQDLKPDNILLCNDGTLKLIDLGSARVASLQESSPRDVLDRPGAADYAAPEYALGLARDTRADQFSLAVTLYELLTGQHPYGEDYDQAQTPAAFHQLRYVSACKYNPHLPLWFDAALRKACAINADNRYEALSELLLDLERPNPGLTPNQRLPWIERDPVKFWKWLALVAVLGNVAWLVRALMP